MADFGGLVACVARSRNLLPDRLFGGASPVDRTGPWLEKRRRLQMLQAIAVA